MFNLSEDLQSRKETLEEFLLLSERVLNYLPNIISGYEDAGDYRLFYSESQGLKKHVRPINTQLFIFDPEKLKKEFLATVQYLINSKPANTKRESEIKNINSVIYTLQQSIGMGMDLLINPNAARKHVGNRFEELVRAVFNKIGVSNKRIVLQIPYETEAGSKIYKCENDLILSSHSEVKSTNQHLDPSEIVVGVKTTSKDRMGKMFIDKMLLERFVKHPQKVIGIFLNDVQRKETTQVSYTLVSGLFMVYTEFLVELEGIYYLDPPPNAYKEPYSNHIKSFGELVTQKIWELLAP